MIIIVMIWVLLSGCIWLLRARTGKVRFRCDFYARLLLLFFCWIRDTISLRVHLYTIRTHNIIIMIITIIHCRTYLYNENPFPQYAVKIIIIAPIIVLIITVDDALQVVDDNDVTRLLGQWKIMYRRVYRGRRRWLIRFLFSTNYFVVLHHTSLCYGVIPTQ